MASTMKVNAGAVTQGNNYLFVDPAQVGKGENSRYFEFSDDQVMEMVASYEMLDNSGNPQGQMVPIECRLLEPSRKLEVHAGRRRLEGALRYNELHPDKPMKLKVLVTKCSAEEALVRGIGNNRDVEATSWVDDCFNQKRLREEYGWSDVNIAKLYRQQPSVVSRLKKLTGLRKKVLHLIHEGVIGLDAGCDLSEVSDTDQDEILEKIKKMQQEHEEAEAKARAEMIETAAAFDTGPETEGKPEEANGGKTEGKPAPKAKKGAKVPPPASNGRKKTKATASQIVKKGVREAKEKAPAADKTKKPRTLKELKEFFSGFDGPAEDPNVRAFAGFVIEYAEGGITDVRMTKLMNQYITPKEPKEPKEPK